MYLISLLLKIDDVMIASMMKISCFLLMRGCLMLVHILICFLFMNSHIDLRYDCVVRVLYLVYGKSNIGKAEPVSSVLDS